MPNFMVVCTFKTGITQEEIAALIPQERAAATALQEQGRVGAINLARSRDTVFIEVIAVDRAAAERTIMELPMAALWDLDFYPLTAPISTP